MFFNLASKSVFVIKLVISGILFSTAVNDKLVAKPLILGILPSTSVILESKSVLTKLVTLGILFSATVNSVLLAKPLISGIFYLTLSVQSSCSVVKRVTPDFVATLVVSGIFFSTLSILSSKALISVVNLVLKRNFEVSIASTLFLKVLYSVFLTTSFLATLLNLAKSLGTVFNLSVSMLSTSVFKAAKLFFNA